MLTIRAAMDTLLGSSLTVSHAGPVTTHNETVNCGLAGREDELAIPAVWILSQFGTVNPANFGGGASENVSYVDLVIHTDDDTDRSGFVLLDEVHAAIEALVRTSESTLGTAYFSHISGFRDAPIKVVDGKHVYSRILTVRALNHQTH